MDMNHRFHRGDVVHHPRKPEWGQGVVKDAQPIRHQGTPAQRLAIEFANKGRVIINTAVAPLAPKASQDSTMSRTSIPTSSSEVGWLTKLEKATGNRSDELWELPEAMTDPFTSLARRLEATLESYRFNTTARSLIDWAVVQTGLDDPLSKYTRHELEQAFPRFARDRDQHLHSLIRQLKRNGEQHVLSETLQKTQHPGARAALAKALRH